ALLALVLQNALQLFELLLVFGAGTGPIFILRWFWWRINAWSEIVAMFVSGILSLALKLTPLGDWLFGAQGGLLPDWAEYPFVVAATTLAWLVATYATAPERDEVLEAFCQKIRPGGPGWKKVEARARARGLELDDGRKWGVPTGILAMLVGSVSVYSLLFATGKWIYGEWLGAALLTALALASGLLLAALWKRIRTTLA